MIILDHGCDVFIVGFSLCIFDRMIVELMFGIISFFDYMELMFGILSVWPCVHLLLCTSLCIFDSLLYLGFCGTKRPNEPILGFRITRLAAFVPNGARLVPSGPPRRHGPEGSSRVPF